MENVGVRERGEVLKILKNFRGKMDLLIIITIYLNNLFFEIGKNCYPNLGFMITIIFEMQINLYKLLISYMKNGVMGLGQIT